MENRKLTFACDCRCEVTLNEKIQSQLNKTKTKLTLGQLGFDNPAITLKSLFTLFTCVIWELQLDANPCRAIKSWAVVKLVVGK